MSYFSEVKNKTDQLLITEFKQLVTQERKVLTRVLHYLREIESRRLYLAHGYPSLFAMMTEELGYSEGAAQRRIQAMRLIKEIPEVKEKISSGEISLSVASQMQSYFRKTDQKRTLEKKGAFAKEEKLALMQQLSGTSSRECEKKLIHLNPELNLPKEKTRPLTPEKTLLQFTAGKPLMAKIEKLKSLLSHQKGENTLEQVIEKITDMALEKLDPKRREERREKRKARQDKAQKCTALPPTSAVVKTTRNIPKKLRDQIWLRDRGACQYRDPKSGKVCGSKHRLQLDHRYPFSLGGENQEENLRLPCRAHNQFHAAQALSVSPPPSQH